jgi:hypothetical protein
VFINAFEYLACLMCISMEEIFEQHRNILSTFSKRRDMDRKYGFFRTSGASGDGNLDEFDTLKVWANMLILLGVLCRRRSN